MPYHLKRTQANRASQNTAQPPPPASQAVPVEVPGPTNPSLGLDFTPLCSWANHYGRAAMPSQTADEILGFARPAATRNLENGLDSEIESYLLDTNVGTSSLMFWQVWQFQFENSVLLTSELDRRINTAIPPSS